MKLDILAAFNTNSRRLIRIWRSWGLVGAKNRKQRLEYEGVRVWNYENDPSKGPQTSDCVSKYHKQVSKAAAAAASAAAAAEAAGEKIGKSCFSIVFSMNP